MPDKKKVNDLENSLQNLSKKLDNIRANKINEEDTNKNRQFSGFPHAFKIVSELFANNGFHGSNTISDKETCVDSRCEPKLLICD